MNFEKVFCIFRSFSCFKETVSDEKKSPGEMST